MGRLEEFLGCFKVGWGVFDGRAVLVTVGWGDLEDLVVFLPLGMNFLNLIS